MKKIIQLASGVIAAALLYLPTLDYPLLWDDESLILANPLLGKNIQWGEFFIQDLHESTGTSPGYWRPLVGITLGINYRLGETDPFSYHLFNVFLHILNTILVWFLLGSILKNQAAGTWGALIFAVHPAATSVVAYVSGRADLLGASFILMGLLFFLGSSRFKIPGIMLCFLLALFSREATIIFPLLLIWAAQTTSRKITPSIALGCLGVLIGYFMIRLGFLEVAVFSRQFEIKSALLRSPLTLIEYLKIFFLPHKLHMLRWFKVPQISSYSFWICCILIGSLTLVTRRWKIWRWGASWFFIALIPVLGFFPLAAPLAENWLYLPGIGLILAGAGTFAGLRQRSQQPGLILFLGLVVMSLMAGQTIYKNKDWSDPVRLYRSVIRADWPDSLEKARGRRLDGVFGNLGNELIDLGQYQQALDCYQKALEINPRHYPSLDGQSRVLRITKNYREALKYGQQALKIRPESPGVLINLGLLYLELGLDKKAKKHLSLARIMAPNRSEPLNNLAIIEARAGNYPQAHQLWKLALDLSPDDPNIKNNLARMNHLKLNPPDPEQNEKLFQTGLKKEQEREIPGAAACYRQALGHPLAHLNLGLIYRDAGDPAAAAIQYRMALLSKPNLTAARINLANIYSDLKLFEQAIAECKAGLKTEPEDARLLNAWGRALGEAGDISGAITKWEQALKSDPTLVEAQKNLERAQKLKNHGSDPTHIDPNLWTE